MLSEVGECKLCTNEPSSILLTPLYINECIILLCARLNAAATLSESCIIF